jgi:hypothetical protein
MNVMGVGRGTERELQNVVHGTERELQNAALQDCNYACAVSAT